MRTSAAEEIGIYYKEITGKRPTRITASRKTGKGAFTGSRGRWRQFLATVMQHGLGITRGIDGLAQHVASAMNKNPPK